MSHIVKDLDWGTIDIVVHEARVFFQQRWKYNWLAKVPLRDWNLTQKRAFHKSVDRQIWASWSNRVKLSVAGTSDFAKNFSSKKIPMNLDVRWVLNNEHWNVTVWKVADNEMPHQRVWWNSRKIELNTSKVKKSYRACNKATPKVCKDGFKSVPHEFGHTIGHGDEYVAGATHLADSDSIMNIGRELRQRHFKSILDEMNKMIPNTTFSVHQV